MNLKRSFVFWRGEFSSGNKCHVNVTMFKGIRVLNQRIFDLFLLFS
jgi:hypothetical protein